MENKTFNIWFIINIILGFGLILTLISFPHISLKVKIIRIITMLLITNSIFCIFSYLKKYKFEKEEFDIKISFGSKKSCKKDQYNRCVSGKT